MFANPFDITRVEDPFPHFLVQRVFADNDLVSGLVRWLQNSDTWFMQDNQHYGVNFSALQLSPEARRIASPDGVRTIVRICEDAFGEPFLPGAVFGVHKIVPGQHIEVHTDTTDNVTHTHRFVVQLPGPEPVSGGDLLLFRENDTEVPARKYSFMPNTGFGFEFSKKSYHAVSPVLRGTRYTLVISFRALRHQTREAVLSSLPAAYTQRLFPAS